MSTSAWSVVVMLTVVFFHSGGHCLTCDDPMELTTGVCGKLSKDFERALLEDEGNLFRIRRLFFHSPTASPVLIKVVYNITFGLNFTAKHCSGEILNSTISDFKQKNITLGWTSSGVYAWFHPTVLSVMQVQSPFAFLRIIHLTLPEQRSLEAESFLWDGSYDLPTLYLNLHVTSLMCVPSEEMLESVIEDLNTLLKVYGGRDEVLSVTDNIEFIGFTLPHTSVTTKVIPLSSDVIFMNLYSSILCILYTVSICLLTVWYFLPSSPAKRKIDSLINSNPDLCLGIRITTTTALVIEFLSRLSHCIIWSCNIENPASTVLAVWMPQIHLLLTAAGQIVFVSIYVSYQTRKNEKKTDDGGNRDCCNTKSELRTFSNLSATAFGLFYMLFPTIVLMFAHPTQIIAIFTFVTAYLFATSIFSASIVKLYNHFDPKCNTQNNRLLHKLRVPFKFALFVALWLIVLYLHFLVIFASYSMLIGRGSVINTGPLFLISLLPSALLSGGAWFAKRVALNDEESTDSEAETGLQNELQEENGNQGMMKFTVQSPLNGLELKPDELESTLNTSPV